MRVVRTVPELREARSAFGDSVGFVPTMGFLHEGHLSLVRRARSECATVIVSIFVNPTQFGPNEDLSAYPRDLDRDLSMLETAGTDLVFAPTVADLYPPGLGAFVDPGPLAERLEGAARPGHFRGVATVVTKLFNVTRPDRAYFGQKDAQQLVVIQSIVRDLHLPVQVVGCPTVREPDGLALSSRNVYLTPEERRAAPALYRGLGAARRVWLRGERSASALRSAVCAELDSQPLLRPEYVSVAHPRTLEEIDTVGRDGALVSLAVRVGRARLIDNIRLDAESEARGQVASMEEQT